MKQVETIFDNQFFQMVHYDILDVIISNNQFLWNRDMQDADLD